MKSNYVYITFFGYIVILLLLSLGLKKNIHKLNMKLGYFFRNFESDTLKLRH